MKAKNKVDAYNDIVSFLGSSQDQKVFKQFISPNNIEYITNTNKKYK